MTSAAGGHRPTRPIPGGQGDGAQPVAGRPDPGASPRVLHGPVYPAGDPLGAEAFGGPPAPAPPVEGDTPRGDVGRRAAEPDDGGRDAEPDSGLERAPHDGIGREPHGDPLLRRRGRARQVSAFGHRTTLPWPRPGTGPMPVVPGPRRRRWLRILGRTLSKAWGDSLFGMSSQAAFWSALSTAPLLLALLGMVGYVGHWFGPGTVEAVQQQMLIFLHGLFSPEVVDTLLAKNVQDLLRGGQADLVSVGFFISLWAGSSAISAFVEAITIAYGQHEVRHPAVERLFALGLYLVALVAGVITLPLLAIGPEALTELFPPTIRHQAGTIITVFYYPAIVIALVLLLATFYKVAPKHKHPWRRGVPGALLATAVFVVASFGLRLYVSYVYTHGLTYGALATPITFLLFYYMMALAIILGAQFNNATLEYYPPRLTQRELRKWQRFDPVADATDPQSGDR